MQLSKDDKYYEIKLSTFNTEKSESLEAADNFDKKLRDKEKKNTLSLFRTTRRSLQK